MNTTTNQAVKAPQEPYRFTKRLGSTTFRVAVHFSRTSRETANDKIARLIRSDAQCRSPCEVDRLRGERRSSVVNELSGSPGSERYGACDDEKAANL